ncbi:TIGR03016 family PEP-CTERM system-associated outer membrane protein [Geomesophilobacter sediminis]|uniref:TIGR03016 family PEP-CTERM system-associated outer membrane protein n=1 Tax=Geomesophilobacter sediminis TaxID=2798584 RepID=A0A8J7M072_9BACT|nr:TIGR03016 family PEP-CTERM system-associated outer membrane protein [Geomesophilobacter sediminis]MBJ6723672.1 TIGR03016 family PEP-CTERM system-associated outer membrane protein [Geomesophilobacter sediminis]
MNAFKRQQWWRLAALLTALGSVVFRAFPLFAADFEWHPKVTASEEYNDNLFEDSVNRRTDFITRIQPGAAFRFRNPYLASEGGYTFDYRNYARGSRSDEYNHAVTLTGQVVGAENFFYVDFSENLTRVSLDVTRDRTLESSFASQTDQNAAIVSPYFIWKVGTGGSLKTGYRYLDTRYWSADAVDRVSQIAFADYNHQLTQRLSLIAGYSYNHVRSTQGSYDRHDVSAGGKYQLGEGSFLFGSAGNSWFAFPGKNLSEPFWNAGLTWGLPHVVTTLETRVQYTDDPLILATEQKSYSGKLDFPLDRGALGVMSTYTEYVLSATGTLDRRQLSVGANARYDFTSKFNASLNVLGDRLSRKTPEDYPYHLDATALVSYICNRDVTLALTYSWITYRYELKSDSGAKDINRVVAEIRKVF